MFTVNTENALIAFAHQPPLPGLKQPLLHAWSYDSAWLALVFTVDSYPGHHGKVGFHHYEGATSAITALYEYCLMGDTCLVLPNVRHRSGQFRKVATLLFPWGSDVVLQTGTVMQTETLEPTVGEGTLTVGLLS